MHTKTHCVAAFTVSYHKNRGVRRRRGKDMDAERSSKPELFSPATKLVHSWLSTLPCHLVCLSSAFYERTPFCFAGFWQNSSLTSEGQTPVSIFLSYLTSLPKLIFENQSLGSERDPTEAQNRAKNERTQAECTPHRREALLPHNTPLLLQQLEEPG